MFDGLHGRSGRSFVQQKLIHFGTHSQPTEHHVFETVRNLEIMSTKPLNQRGWVLQESILSFRSLIFDRKEVRWACPQMKACECLPEGHMRQSWLSHNEGVIDKELYEAWSEIVARFSERKLTHAKDKLPALAGIANEMSTLNKSEYLAGLWKGNLRRDLAWFVPANNVRAPRHTTKRPADRAPTWSWASIDGSVRTYGVRSSIAQELNCEILNVTATPLNQLNIFGEVKSGELVLRGRMGAGSVRSLRTTDFRVDRWPFYVDQQLGWLNTDLLPSKLVPHTQIGCMPLLHDGTTGELKCLALTFDGQNWQRVGMISPLPGQDLEIWLRTCAITTTTVK